MSYHVIHVPVEYLPINLPMKKRPYRVYNLMHIALTRVLAANRILIYLRGRPHKEQPPGLELGTQGRQSQKQTAGPYRRLPVCSNYCI